MERGKIVEIGPHHQLLKKPGHYARLHKAQMELAHGLSEPSIAIAP
jgi:ATP-binding cassette subfamily B protein